MQTFTAIVTLCNGVATILALVLLLVRPAREKLLGLREIRAGARCMLRSNMLNIYYKNRESDTIRQYEKENFMLLYQAYKALGGNSFIDDIHKEVRRWEVTT